MIGRRGDVGSGVQILGSIPCRRLDIRDIRVGSGVSFEYHLDNETVDDFAALTCDRSPIHMSAEAAAHRGLPGRVAHGMLVSSVCSTVVGMFLPGESALLISLQVNYIEPVLTPARLLLSAKVVQVSAAARSLRLSVVVTDRGLKVCHATIGVLLN